MKTINKKFKFERYEDAEDFILEESISFIDINKLLNKEYTIEEIEESLNSMSSIDSINRIFNERREKLKSQKASLIGTNIFTDFRERYRRKAIERFMESNSGKSVMKSLQSLNECLEGKSYIPDLFEWYVPLNSLMTHLAIQNKYLMGEDLQLEFDLMLHEYGNVIEPILENIREDKYLNTTELVEDKGILLNEYLSSIIFPDLISKVRNKIDGNYSEVGLPASAIIEMGENFSRLEDIVEAWETEIDTSEFSVISEGVSEVDGVNIIAKASGPAFFPGVVSRNNRLYPKEAWDNAISRAEFKKSMDERMVFGTIGHDQKIDDEALRDGKISHIVSKMWINEDGVGQAEYLILNTGPGNTMKTLLGAGSKVKVSTRAKGLYESKRDTKTGAQIVDKNNFYVQGVDFVIDPGYLDATPNLNKG